MVFKLFIDKSRQEEVVATVHRRTSLIDEIERLVMQDGGPNRLSGYLDDEIAMLEIEDIECFVVEDEKTFAVYGDRTRYLIKKRLYELEQLLPKEFERISRSAIANWKRIAKFKVQLSGAVDAVFQCGYTECVSRRCFVELKRRYEL